MIKRLILITLISLISLHAGRKKNPATMQFPTSLDFTPPQVDRFTLSNGIQVFLAEDHEVPLIDINILVTVGEDHISSEKAGLTRILAELITDAGSKSIPERVFKDSLENIGASFSGYSSTRIASYTLHMLSEHTPALLPLVVDALRNPGLPQSILDIKKRQNLIRYQGRNTEPSSIAGRVYRKLIYGEISPTARETTPVSLKNIDIQALRQFHQANYRPEKIMIGVSGDFDSKVMLDLLELYLGDWQEPEISEWDKYDLIMESADPGVYVVQRPGSIQSYIYLGYLGIMLSDPQYTEALMLSEIYGSSWSSRIHDQVREERGLAYVSSGVIAGGRTIPGPFTAVCFTKSETTIEAIDVIQGIIEDLKTDGVTEDELALAKDSWLASFPRYYEETEGVMRSQMSYVKDGYPIDFREKLPPKIEETTIEDVNKFAADFLNIDSLVIVVLVDTTLLDGSLSQFGEVIVIDSEEY